MHYRQSIGKWGEAYAEKYLQSEGLRFIARNERTPYGEIDLIVQDGEIIVYVEVKTRTTEAYGYPEAAINFRKRKHLIESALFLSQKYQDYGDHWRIDVISIYKPRGKKNEPVVEWFKNAVDEY
jgi:putative endonuclease